MPPQVLRNPRGATGRGLCKYIRHNPTGWKSAVRKAKRIALLRELWEAELEQYRGLFLRACVKSGARLPEELAARDDPTEVCAPCGRTFADLRAWSRHAFKCHGRVNPSRRLASGTQCMVCLTQYKTNRALCAHFNCSRRCRAALHNANFACSPERGIGSRKYDDGNTVLLPAFQAEGPRAAWDVRAACDERDLPSEEVLLALEDCFSNDAAQYPSFQDLLHAVRAIFCRQCLQRSRLRDTAHKWRHSLETSLSVDEEVSVDWASWHTRIATFLCDADFVEWLGGDSGVSPRDTATFRDADKLLPWVELDCVAFVLCQGALEPKICIHGEVCFRHFAALDFSCRLAHTTCKQKPASLDFANWAGQEASGGAFLFSCLGLLPAFDFPQPTRSSSSLRVHSFPCAFSRTSFEVPCISGPRGCLPV